MFKFIYPLLVAGLLLACESSELHESMEKMGDSFKTMRKSEDLIAIKAQFAEFKAGFDIASQQKVDPKDQAIFDEGTQKIKQLIVEVDSALASNDLPATKIAFERLGETRKEYHKKLDVK